MEPRAPRVMVQPPAGGDRPVSPLRGFYRSTVGKKFVVATTGVILFGYVIVHMLGNMQVFLGRERLNAYAELLHTSEAALWGARIALIVAVVLHIVASVQLAAENWGNRPRYARQRWREADFTSRTMIVTGPIVAIFVVYHILHFTTGDAHTSFVAGDVYHNVTAAFSLWPVALVYIVANLLLGFHLYHGVWSLFQTLGVSHPAWDPWRRVFATTFAAVIVAGNVGIPLAILLGAIP